MPKGQNKHRSNRNLIVFTANRALNLQGIFFLFWGSQATVLFIMLLLASSRKVTLLSRPLFPALRGAVPELQTSSIFRMVVPGGSCVSLEGRGGGRKSSASFTPSLQAGSRECSKGPMRQAGLQAWAGQMGQDNLRAPRQRLSGGGLRAKGQCFFQLHWREL